jgi:hypothetical protein
VLELHFSQDAAILPGIVKKISQTVASAFAAWLLPRSGQWVGAGAGLCLSSAGLLVYGVGSLCCLGKVSLPLDLSILGLTGEQLPKAAVICRWVLTLAHFSYPLGSVSPLQRYW